MLMLLLVVMGMTVQSCSKEETKIVGGETVAFLRDDFSKTLKFRGVDFSEFANEAAITKLAVEDQELVLLFLNAVAQGDKEVESLMVSGSVPSDSKVLSIYNNELSSFKSGKGFEGYIIISKTVNGGRATEIGRITFTK